MVDKFLEIFMKLISGEYAYLYPRDFHSALTQVLPLFGDRKQVMFLGDIKQENLRFIIKLSLKAEILKLLMFC